MKIHDKVHAFNGNMMRELETISFFHFNAIRDRKVAQPCQSHTSVYTLYKAAIEPVCSKYIHLKLHRGALCAQMCNVCAPMSGSHVYPHLAENCTRIGSCVSYARSFAPHTRFAHKSRRIMLQRSQRKNNKIK